MPDQRLRLESGVWSLGFFGPGGFSQCRQGFQGHGVLVPRSGLVVETGSVDCFADIELKEIPFEHTWAIDIGDLDLYFPPTGLS